MCLRTPYALRLSHCSRHCWSRSWGHKSIPRCNQAPVKKGAWAGARGCTGMAEAAQALCSQSGPRPLCSRTAAQGFRHGASWPSPCSPHEHLSNRRPALLVHASRSYNFQELSRPQNQYFPHMPILSNCGYSFLTGFGNAWGLWIHSWSWNSRVSTALCPG